MDFLLKTFRNSFGFVLSRLRECEKTSAKSTTNHDANEQDVFFEIEFHP